MLAIFYSCATLPLRAAFGDNQVGGQSWCMGQPRQGMGAEG